MRDTGKGKPFRDGRKLKVNEEKPRKSDFELTDKVKHKGRKGSEKNIGTEMRERESQAI